MNNKPSDSLVDNLIEKDHQIWVKALPSYPNPFEDAFLEGKVIQFTPKQVSVDIAGAQKIVKAPIENCLKLTYGPQDVADMVDLEELNEPQLLFNIKRRYVVDNIFTYCGPTLLIINPYQYIQKLFNDSVLQEYQTMVFQDNLEYKALQPHVFGLAAFCLWQLFDNERNQSIVISGESGAGKTQNTKSCLKFLASLGKNMKELLADTSSKEKNKRINYQNMRMAEKALKKTSSKVFGIEQKILGCNQILEAFGNSKTIRNDNSSRFGKLILLLYGQTQIDIKSAFITSYLLQKSRIVSVSDGERNYHVFYYFCKGTTEEEKKKYLLNDPIDKYYYLNQSTVYQIPKASDEENFKQIQKQFKVYLNDQEIDCVYRILSIVLNNGNLLFKKGQTANNEEIAIITNEEYIKNVTELLQVDYEKFKHSFQFKTRKMGTNVINSPLKFAEALALRDSFSKNIYEKIFNYLVIKLNEKIQIQKIDFSGGQKGYRKSIGLLDIFGFQVLMVNSLEQFFINFANEKLQQLYVSYIFKEEQEEFLREGLKQYSQDIGFQDNKPIIDLFELFPKGIFHLVNESSELNKPDENLPETITKIHPKSTVITIPKTKRGFFQIGHSCSPVSYNTDGFTAKNKDEFPKQLLQIIETSQNQTLKTVIMLQSGDGKASKKASSKFLGTKFLSQMNKLTEELYACDCHFVRCIKPNSKKSPRLFNSEAVLQSLRYLGVLDSIIIRKLGYIYRRPFKQFHKKFFQLQGYIFNYLEVIKDKSEEDFKELCKKTVDKFAKKQLSDNKVLFGNKKILIKESALNYLELLTKQKRKMRIHTANRVKIIYRNKVFRGKVRVFNTRIGILKKHMLQLLETVRENIKKKKVSKIQSSIRKYLMNIRFQKIKEEGTKSVTKISAFYKMKRQRRKFLEIKAKSVRLQANCRAFITMGKYFKQKTIKSIINGYFEKAWNIIEEKNAKLIQRTWRGYKVRKQFEQAIKMMKSRSFLKRAIVKFRYQAFKELLMLYKKPVMKMQAIVRGRYLRKIFVKTRESVLLIQKAYRRHLTKKFYLDKVWKKYKYNLNDCEELKLKELTRLGVSNKNSAKKLNINETAGGKMKLYPQSLIALYGPEKNRYERDLRINETINFPDKNTLQTYIIDMDIISPFKYRGTWTEKYANIKEQMSKKGQYPLKINIGDGMTTILTNKDRLYCFSGKDQDYSKIDIKISPSLISLNDQSGYLVSKQHKMYVWGDNSSNQLFTKIKKPTLPFSCNPFVNYCTDIEAKGNLKYYSDGQGKVYQHKQEKVTLVKLGKVQISHIISSYTFTHFLSNTGQLFSQGNNINGQLGIGKISNECSQPVLNQYFVNKKQSIETISVGIGHTIARSKLGYSYIWGDNRFGQVSIEKVPNITAPILVQIDKQKTKVLQAVAGLRSTFVFLQSFRIMGLGTSTGFPSQKNSDFFLQQLLFGTNLNSKNLIPLKISCTWTREMSLLTVNCLEQNKCKAGTKPQVIYKYCKILAKDWPQKQVYPPYHEWTDNILNLADMRKFKFQQNQNQKIKSGTSSKLIQSDLEEIKLLMDLRKTSTLFKTAARKKIEEVLRNLDQKPSKQWTNEDKELNTYIREHCKIALK